MGSNELALCSSPYLHEVREQKGYIKMLQKNGFPQWTGERIVWVYLADKANLKENI